MSETFGYRRCPRRRARRQRAQTPVIRSALLLLVAVASPLNEPAAAVADDRGSASARTFFENKIRPVLVKHCYQCHSAEASELGGNLRLDTRDGLRQGGQSGPAVVPGNAERSLILQALRYDGIEMPPEQPLPENVVADFVRWVKEGAYDPRVVKPASPGAADDPDATAPPADAASLWAFRSPVAPKLPRVKLAAWPADPLDVFVLARLEEAGIRPTADADPRTLFRRLSFALLGLPPTRDEQEAFVADCRRDRQAALVRWVDELMSRPQFGERWGRHWLDVARYGESNGNDGLGRNPTFPHAWRYRDYVIDAFNADTPYDQFLTEQVAGDLLPADTAAQRDRQKIATGFLALGSKPAKAMNTNFDMDVVADQIDVIGRGILGVSVACARCHDHKFDPIPTRDYYALAGIFSSTQTMWGLAANEGLTAPTTDLHVLEAAPRVPPPADFIETVLVLESNTGKPKKIPAPPWPAGTPLAMGVRDRPKPADCKINIKGDAKKLGEAVPRGFLSACQFEPAEPGDTAEPGDAAEPGGAAEDGESPAATTVNPKQSGRRELAKWLTRDDHPLTARVMVNRVWSQLFGEGIVRTVDDFGVYGERPTHPRLLDHLATRFVREGWSVKRLIRAIVLSRTWQLSSTAEAAAIAADPENRLLGRHNRRRLDAEALRDSMLQVCGELDLSRGQGSLIRHRDILVNLAGNLHQPSNHRSVYLCYLRSALPPVLAAFDLPDFTAPVGQRETNTIPGQALHLFNSPFVVAQATQLAERAAVHAPDEQRRIQWIWQQTLNRQPSDSEREQAQHLVETTRRELGSEPRAWASLCQAVLLTNEFRYLD